MKPYQYALPLGVETGTATSPAPAETIRRWADIAHDDLPKLAQMLRAMGWEDAQLSADNTQLDIRGPSGVHISFWHGLERSVVMVQLSLGWLGPLGVITG